ncbi:MAG TPA: DUF2723 domain-containing protein, partial [Acidobacteriota bacterium]|nr:DUF2723 domain-containing protein [Acidobacteriota bacterium]
MTDWKRWHAAFAAIAFAVPLFVYLRTMNVTVPFWDSGEFIATSYILGNPHPPGNPLYTLVGRIFTLVPIGSIAQRVNFISALCGAFACFFTFLIVARALRRTFEDQFQTGAARLAALVGGLVAAFFLAWSTSAWTNSIEAEASRRSSARAPARGADTRAPKLRSGTRGAGARRRRREPARRTPRKRRTRRAARAGYRAVRRLRA